MWGVACMAGSGSPTTGMHLAAHMVRQVRFWRGLVQLSASRKAQVLDGGWQIWVVPSLVRGDGSGPGLGALPCCDIVRRGGAARRDALARIDKTCGCCGLKCWDGGWCLVQRNSCHLAWLLRALAVVGTSRGRQQQQRAQQPDGARVPRAEQTWCYMPNDVYI